VKKLTFLMLLVAGLACATITQAQVFGQYTPADVLAVNARQFGAYVDFSENTAGLLGQLRLSFYPNVDFGFQGGLSRFDLGSSTKTTLRLGSDLRAGVVKAGEQSPVDVAAGGAVGVETTDNYTSIRLGPSVVASRSFALSGDAAIVPYAGVMLCFANVTSHGDSETDFSLPLRLGGELRAIPGVRITAELQLRLGDDFDDDTAFSAGVNLPF
jgi:hypothetical protein